MGVRAYLGLGSNLGERREQLQRAVDLLHAAEGVRVLRSSRVYETEPVGGPPQPDYLNAVVEIETSLEATELLETCRAVEAALGRVRDERWGPRTIDVDILTFGAERIDLPELVVPHPRMHERIFVLAPLLELHADPPLPRGKRAGELTPESAVPTSVRPAGPPLEVPA